MANPVIPNAQTEDEHEQNRRVEIKLLNKTKRKGDNSMKKSICISCHCIGFAFCWSSARFDIVTTVLSRVNKNPAVLATLPILTLFCWVGINEPII